MVPGGPFHILDAGPGSPNRTPSALSLLLAPLRLLILAAGALIVLIIVIPIGLLALAAGVLLWIAAILRRALDRPQHDGRRNVRVIRPDADTTQPWDARP